MPENRLFDKRCAKHYISTGALTQEAFQLHLDALPNLAEKACPLEAALNEETPLAKTPETPKTPGELPLSPLAEIP